MAEIHLIQLVNLFLIVAKPWPHPRLLELFVDEVHLVQTALNLLDAVGR